MKSNILFIQSRIYHRKSLVFAVMLMLTLFSSHAQTVYDLTSGPNTIQTWTVPAGVYCIQVDAWGGGGGGGRSTDAGTACSGGGGGAYAGKSMTVTPGQTIQYFIGGGGNGSSGANNGGDTWFSSTTTLLAKGGIGTANNTETPSAGGSATLSIGDVTFAGGNGGPGSNGGSSNDGGGGGGAAGTTAPGMNGGPGLNSASTVGTNGTRMGGSAGAGYPFTGATTGRGGNGTDDAGTGDAGALYGSGGGGGKNPLLWVTNHDGGNGRQGVIRITVTPPPTISIIASTTTICAGESVTFTATVANQGAGATYDWKINNVSVSNGTNLTYTTTTLQNNDVVSVSLTDNSGCAPNPINSNTIIITYGGTTNTLNQTVCQNELPFSFGNQSLTAAGTYTQSFPTNTGCDSTVILNLTVIQGLNISIQKVDVACFGGNTGSATVTVNPAGNYTYQWSNNQTGATISNLTAGNYTVVVSTVSGSGCTSSATTVINAPQQGMEIDLDIVNPSCENIGGSISATVNNGVAPYTYAWTPNGQNTASINALSSGTYDLVVTDASGCTQQTQAVLVGEGTMPVLVVSSEASIFVGENTNLNATVTGTNFGVITYEWSPAATLSCITCPNPIATPLTYGNIEYTVTVTSEFGCQQIEKIIVIVKEICGDLYIPSNFSPNGDGVNDRFTILGTCINHSSMSIYNRWGQRIFTTDDYKEGWDGTHKGLPVNNDSYTYKISVTLNDGTVIDRSGSIAVSR